MLVNNQKLNPVTSKQQAILKFIYSYYHSHGYAPSLREIQKHFHLKATSTIHQHIEALKKKGLLKKRGFQHRSMAVSEMPDKIIQIPLLGRISAGPLNEPIENSAVIDIPNFMIKGDKSDYYALKVNGDSMIKDGIWDGDIILVKHQKEANVGDMIVAVSDGEATLKRYGGIWTKGVKLIPRNSDLKPYFVKPDTFEIRGKFVGLIRES